MLHSRYRRHQLISITLKGNAVEKAYGIDSDVNADRTIGFMLTGQVALELPSAAGFEGIIRRLADWGVQVDLNRLRNAYYRSGVLSPDQYSGLIRLLEIFAQQLSLMASEMMIRDAEAEAPMIRRARAYIAGHLADPISLHDVARALHVSPFYFCRIFKKATSLTFSAYLSRTSGTGKESPAKFSSSYQ
jgi:Bacterial regulatory helix-turn-helix proteins, AraC family